MEAELARADALCRFLSADPVARIKTGQSPHSVIHKDRSACVRLFAPKKALHNPIFICMPLINTWTIFDLLPGRSVVEALVAKGVPVYLLDWGRPGPEDKARTLEDLIDGTLKRCLERAGRHARVQYQSEKLDAVGYCVGGTFLTVALSRYPGLARRLCLLAAPIDFHQSGRLASWATPERFPLNDIVDGYGNFPAELMRQSFAWLKPMGQVSKWKSLWDRFENPGFTELWAAMEQWNGDNTDFAGEAYREYVKSCYFDNALMVGGWKLAGREVLLKEGVQPALVLAAADDHIVPPAAAFALQGHWGGTVETKILKGGHVGVCVGKELPQAILSWIHG